VADDCKLDARYRTVSLSWCCQSRTHSFGSNRNAQVEVPIALPLSWNKGRARITVPVAVEEASAGLSPLQRRVRGGRSSWSCSAAVVAHNQGWHLDMRRARTLPAMDIPGLSVRLRSDALPDTNRVHPSPDHKPRPHALTLALTLTWSWSVCRCRMWVETPAIMFHLPSHENMWHFLNDGLLLVLQTLLETDLLPTGVRRSVFVSDLIDSLKHICAVI